MNRWIGFLICQFTIYFNNLVVLQIDSRLLSIICAFSLLLFKYILYNFWINRFCTLKNGKMGISFLKRWLGYLIASVSTNMSVSAQEHISNLSMYVTLILGCIVYYVWVSYISTEVALENLKLDGEF